MTGSESKTAAKSKSPEATEISEPGSNDAKVKRAKMEASLGSNPEFKDKDLKILIPPELLTGEPTRDKCIDMLVVALSVDSGQFVTDDEVVKAASAIEACLFEEFNGIVDQKYRAKFRSKYLNLKDLANPTLRNAILSGLIKPDQFCSMTAAEMASDERKRIDALLNEQNLRNARAVQDTQAETDQFKCGRCKQRKCKYYQLQTRSADEPMTTFVTCVNCGHKWKVNPEVA